MIFTSKNASTYAYKTVFTTHVKMPIYQFWYFTHRCARSDCQGGGINPENSKIGLPVHRYRKFEILEWFDLTALVRGKYPFCPSDAHLRRKFFEIMLPFSGH